MTLKEAKKKIKAQAEAEWEEFRKTGSMLCQGFALGADDALETLDKVESSGNPDKLTLTELAREMRKLFDFRWLTVDEGKEIQLWVCFSEDDPPEFYEDGCWYSDSPMTDELCSILPSMGLFAIDLDLSEYKDADGNIDYSKCIVEVEE